MASVAQTCPVFRHNSRQSTVVSRLSSRQSTVIRRQSTVSRLSFVVSRGFRDARGRWESWSKSRHRCGRNATPRRLVLAGFAGEGSRRHNGHAFRHNRVVATMAMASAGFPFFFHVGDFATRRDFAVLADDAAAGKRCKAKEPNQTIHTVPFCVCIRATFVPLSYMPGVLHFLSAIAVDSFVRSWCFVALF